jgi:hypothetical protein
MRAKAFNSKYPTIKYSSDRETEDEIVLGSRAKGAYNKVDEKGRC